MNDPAHVRLVDAHAEGDRRHHDLRIVANVCILVATARVRVQACVIGQCLDAVALQSIGELIDSFAGQAIHDAGRTLLRPLQQFRVCVFVLAADGVMQIGSIEARDMDRRVAQGKLLDDVAADALGRSGRECDERNAGTARTQLRELTVLRPEIMTPLGDAMRFVDDEGGDS